MAVSQEKTKTKSGVCPALGYFPLWGRQTEVGIYMQTSSRKKTITFFCSKKENSFILLQGFCFVLFLLCIVVLNCWLSNLGGKKVPLKNLDWIFLLKLALLPTWNTVWFSTGIAASVTSLTSVPLPNGEMREGDRKDGLRPQRSLGCQKKNCPEMETLGGGYRITEL